MARKKQENRKLPVLLIVLGVVLLLVAVAAIVLQRLALNPPAAEPPPVGEVDTYAEVPRVTLEEAKAAFDEGRAVFVDVRGPGAFEAGRIPGSVLIPLNEMETRWNELDPNDWIITYCT